MTEERKAYLVGGGIGSLAAAAFMVRDGGMPGANITLYEALPLLGGSLDGAGNPEDGYSMRGGRMLTTDNFECFWDLFKTVPSLADPKKTVYDETVEFNERMKTHSNARLVDRNRAIVDVTSMGFTTRDRIELLKLAEASEEKLETSVITDWLSPEFFTSTFWYLWQTTFAFSALAQCRRIQMLSAQVHYGVLPDRDPRWDQAHDLQSVRLFIRPLVQWLGEQGVHFLNDSTVTGFGLESEDGKTAVAAIKLSSAGKNQTIAVGRDDLVFFQNGSMTDASSLGSMTAAPKMLTKEDSGGWTLWEKLAEDHPEFGNPGAFNASIPETYWASFTVTLKDTVFFDQMEALTGNKAGTGGLVTFKDSNWLMSVVLAHQPHFANQPADVRVFWGYALHPDRVGDFVAKSMSDCGGEEILQELCGHLNFDLNRTFAAANCIPCRMPYITSMFMPRAYGDRPLPVPKNSKNLAFVSQFVEIPEDAVFTVEYSVRAAQMAVYQLLGIDREIPPILHHDKSLKVNFDAVVKAFK